jgi:hypothetical protein
MRPHQAFRALAGSEKRPGSARRSCAERKILKPFGFFPNHFNGFRANRAVRSAFLAAKMSNLEHDGKGRNRR